MGYWKIVVPEATTNLITNPSFETGTTGWTVSGTNTIAQSNAQSIFGNYSLLCTYHQYTDMARYDITLTAVQHYFTVYVYIPSGWDGGAVSLDATGFTSMTVNQASTSTTTTDKWVRLTYSFTPDAGDLSGTLRVLAATTPTDGKFIYIDGAQLEVKAYSTTYCDGDQGGCKWGSVPHASTSTREADSRAGGRVRDFGDDFAFPIERVSGAGFPGIKNVITERTFAPGSEYQRFKVPGRQLVLISTIAGTTLANYHTKRQALINILAPDGVPSEESIILQYTGAAITKEIKARYAGGLEMKGPSGFTEVIGLQFDCVDQPLFTQIGEQSSYATTRADLSTKNVAGRIDGIWSNLGQTAASTGDIQVVLAGPDGYIYFGGNFTNLAGIANADYIARYDPSTNSWAALGTGMNGAVYALEVMPNGDILAGGAFTLAGGLAVKNVAQWDGASWSNIGGTAPSSGGTVYAIAVDKSNNDIYIGGSFTNWDAIANADLIARYSWAEATDGWYALGTGMTGTAVRALAWDGGGNLYIAGDFTAINGTSADSLALWDVANTTEYALSTSTNAIIYTLYVDSDSTLYIGGGFTTIGGETHNYMASWNGSAFSDVGDNPVGTVTGIDKWGDFLVVVGNFTDVGGLGDWANVSGRMAYWGGSTWVLSDCQITGNINAVAVDGDDIYLGFVGDYTSYGSVATTVTAAGNARAYPIITITLDFTDPECSALPGTIFNVTTGKKLFLHQSIREGEEITIYLNPENVRAVSSFRGEIWPFLPGSDLTHFYLQPGDNVIATLVRRNAVGGSATVDTFITWKDAYWSID